MSDWQIPDDLADNLRRANYADAWAREIERTAELRGILTDLIAELRDWAEESLEHDGKVDWRLVGRRTNVLADRAEVRLKKLNDE